MSIRSFAAVVLVVAGCGDTSTPLPQACEDLGSSGAAASLPDRRLLGAGSAYPGDPMLRARMDELETSQRARRAAAWEVVERVIAPVPLAVEVPLAGAEVPRFRTWMDRDDVVRVFHHLYEGLGAGGRAERAAFGGAALDEAFAWNVDAIDEQPTWTSERWDAYVGALGDGAGVAGVGGIRRIAMSPDAARHVVASYREVVGCLEDGAPPAFVDGPAEEMQRVAREEVALPACGTRVLGPYFVAAGETLVATLTGAGRGAAEMRVRREGEELCRAEAERGCTAGGPGALTVEVVARDVVVRGMLEVVHTAPAVAYAPCLDGVFPLGSASVALEWQRVDPTLTFAVHETSAEALGRVLGGDEATWGAGERTADPGPEEIYTVRIPSGEIFRLAGMHIRTRELDDWVHITMWWSDLPGEDFGADRPASITGPWAHYKMCVTVGYEERDPDPSGGLAEVAPSLGAALAAVHEGEGGPTWCSNPYIDAAPGLARGNCVGCHQHAMSGALPGEIATDEARYPRSGRTRLRNNDPADGFWGLDAGDDLAAEMANEISYWESAGM